MVRVGFDGHHGPSRPCSCFDAGFDTRVAERGVKLRNVAMEPLVLDASRRLAEACNQAPEPDDRGGEMVGVTGLEPVTPSLSNERSGMEEPQETRLSGPPVGVLGQVLAPTRGGAPLGSGHVADALAAAGALLQNAVQSERHPVLIQAVRVILEAAARSLESDPTFGEER